MALSSAAQIRAWTGPAILSFGFRPFFLLGTVWAVVSMMLWLAMVSGTISLPTAFDPVSWHAHEFLFGYTSAIIAGFLLTAVPNWTGRLPVVGWALGALVLLWLLGRVAIATSSTLTPLAVAVADLAFPLVLAGVILREIVAGKNWRNLIVLALLVTLFAGNALFHWEAANTNGASGGYGLRLGLATSLMMIVVIGGRVVPSFTRNWLVKAASAKLPTPPMQRFDKLAILFSLLALIAWIIWPDANATGGLLILMGAIQFARMIRWRGWLTGAEPMVWVLHAGYALVPLGALLLGASIFAPQVTSIAAAQHVWMAGAIGLMTLAVMTRATLGHTGHALTAGRGTTALYLLILMAVAARFAAGIFPGMANTLYLLSGMAWIGAFGGFVVLYGPLLLRPKPDRN